MTTKVNLDIAEAAVLHVPANMTVDGTELVIGGLVTFNNLVVEKGGTLKLLAKSRTGKYQQGQYVHTSLPGSYLLKDVVLKHGSSFRPEVGLQLQVEFLEMKRFVVLETDFVNITANKLILERGAELNVVGRAARNVSSSSTGSGKNGGGHASEGGVSSGSNLAAAASAFGTLYTPDKPGSAGGSGGLGGSFIRILVDTLILDGNLRADGGGSAIGGAGSGGSIWLTADVSLTGLGVISAIGGSTSCDCGAGSGGRIATYAKNNAFHGEYKASGGTAPKTAPYGAGGPGSIFIRSSLGSDDLTVDNANGQLHHYMNIFESQPDISFDNVYASNYAKVQLSNDGVPRTLAIKKVHGDRTGLIKVQKNQKGTLERYMTGNQTRSKLQINLELHDGGEFILSETTTILGKAPIALDLNGLLRGVVNLVVGQGRKMVIGKSARIVPFKETNISRSVDVTFGLLQLDPGSTVQFHPNTGANMIVGTLNVKFGAKLEADYFKISSSSVIVELEGSISCSGTARSASSQLDITTGSGKQVGTSYGGAGHGGIGGEAVNDRTAAGTPYGSLVRPILAGSRGSQNGGRGGGIIQLNVGYDLINDGTISTDGSGSPYGGGSGGSILISGHLQEGYGVFSSTGGDGSGRGGGASAGRIAIHSTLHNQYNGEYRIHGGDAASDVQAGGGGTVYLEEPRSGNPYKRLLLDNNNRPSDKYATLDEQGYTQYHFDEVHLTRKASMHIKPTGTPIVLKVVKMFGDKTGLLHAHENQRFFIEYEEGLPNAFTTGVNFIVDHNAELILPSHVYVYGSGIRLRGYQESRSLQLSGRLTGVSNLIVGQSSSMYFTSTAHTAFLIGGQYSFKDAEGEFRLGSLDMRSASRFIFSPDIPLKASISRMDVRFEAIISAESFHISASIANVEAGSKLTCSAADRPLDTLDSTKGTGKAGTYGSGAGHTSEGGHSPSVKGGAIYGRLTTPTERGSAGGKGSSGQAGKGGGVMDVNIVGKFFVDGMIFAGGSDGVANSGAGSGGSIRSMSAELEGHGTFDVSGAKGYTGGSGGRLVVNTTLQNHFEGKYIALGGDGSAAGVSHGGPGSVYLEQRLYKVKHSQLRLDNGGRLWDQYYLLNEPSTTSYLFDELHVLRNVSFHMLDDGTERSFTAHKVIGDGTARVHMHNKHTYRLETSSTAVTTTKTNVNLWIEEGAKTYMASTVYITGLGETALFWNGEIVGVRHFRVVPGRNIKLGPKAQTSMVVNNAYVKGTPGTFRFSSLELGAGAELIFPPPMGMIFTVGFLVS